MHHGAGRPCRLHHKGCHLADALVTGKGLLLQRFLAPVWGQDVAGACSWLWSGRCPHKLGLLLQRFLAPVWGQDVAGTQPVGFARVLAQPIWWWWREAFIAVYSGIVMYRSTSSRVYSSIVIYSIYIYMESGGMVSKCQCKDFIRILLYVSWLSMAARTCSFSVFSLSLLVFVET